MSTPAIVTKIEQLTDAIEDLVLAAVTGKHEAVQDARVNVAAALTAFMIPNIRVIEGGKQRQECSLDERIKCDLCKLHAPCQVQSCPHWARAVRAARAAIIDEPVRA